MDNKRYDRIADLNESNRLLHQANHQLRAKLSSKDAEITRPQADNEALRAALKEIHRISGAHPIDTAIHRVATNALERQSVEGERHDANC